MDSGVGEDEVGTEDAVVSALIEIHRRRQKQARPASEESVYARVLSHFEKRGQRLRGERLVTGELLERIFSSAHALEPATPQQELVIAGPLGGVAAGRFMVRNGSSQEQQPSFVFGEPLDGSWTPALRFEPAYPVLVPGGACLVRVEADLVRLSTTAPLTIPVECRTGAVRARLWLVIEPFDGSGAVR